MATSSQCIKKDSADTQNIYRKKAPRWALQVGGEAEDQNLHGRGAQSIESTKEVSTRWPSLERGLLLWSAFDWGHHMDIKQFSDKQMYSNITLFTSFILSSNLCTTSLSLALSSARLSELWVHYTPLTALYEVIVATLAHSLIRDCQKRWAADQRRSREIGRARKRSAGSNWHHIFLIHCKGYFPIKRMNYVFKMLIRRNGKQSKLSKTKADVI